MGCNVNTMCLYKLLMVTSTQLPPLCHPVDSCSRVIGKEELLILQQDIKNDKIKSDQLLSHSKEKIKDESEEQACSRSEELVVSKKHNWSLSSDNDNTTVCRYCREEVKNYYYKDHFVSCPGCVTSNSSVACTRSQEHKPLKEHYPKEVQKHKRDFVVNCIAVEASKEQIKDVSEEQTCGRSEELVVSKMYDWSLSSDNDNTTVCRYCREEVKNYYHKDHLESCKSLTACKRSQEHKALKEHYPKEVQKHKCDFVVNCITMEASDRLL